MTRSILFLYALAIVIPSVFFPSIVMAQTPIGSRWWPSEFGADDQRGAINRLTPQKVLEANQLVTD